MEISEKWEPSCIFDYAVMLFAVDQFELIPML